MFFWIFIIVIVLLVISISKLLSRKKTVKEFRNKIKSTNDILEITDRLKLTFGIAKLKVRRVCYRNSCHYKIDWHLTPMQSVETNSIVLDKLCKLTPSTGIIKRTILGEKIDRAIIIMPIAKVEKPDRYRDIVIACIDRDSWNNVKKNISLTSEYQNDVVIVDADLQGNSILVKGRILSKTPLQWTYMYDKEKGMYVVKQTINKCDVKSYKVYFEICLEDLCRKTLLLESRENAEAKIQLWQPGRELFIGYIGEEFIDEIAMKFLPDEGFVGLCGEKCRILLQLNIPLRRDIIVESDITTCI